VKIKYCPNCRSVLPLGNYSYWENKPQTTDEKEILHFLIKSKILKKNILHIGIGNSEIALKLSEYNNIIGITISKPEILSAKKKLIKNYKTYLINKYSNKLNLLKKYKFDIVIDINLKSYSCCKKAFEKMFSTLSSLLNKNGFLITNKKGMNWSCVLKPKLTFTIKRFGKRILKEENGPKTNKFTIQECKILAKKNNLRLIQKKKTNIVLFKK